MTKTLSPKQLAWVRETLALEQDNVATLTRYGRADGAACKRSVAMVAKLTAVLKKQN